jgi:hypothetical protein
MSLQSSAVVPTLKALRGKSTVNGPGAADVQVRAVPLRPELHYRMDTIQAAAADRYVWPTDLLAKYGLGPRTIGIIAWAPIKLAGEDRILLLPISVGSQPAGNVRLTEFELAILPPLALKRLYVKVARLGADGKVKAQLKDPKLPVPLTARIA